MIDPVQAYDWIRILEEEMDHLSAAYTWLEGKAPEGKDKCIDDVLGTMAGVMDATAKVLRYMRDAAGR
jgi:hypothetical protein